MGILRSNKQNHQEEPLRNEEDKGQPLTNKSKHQLMRPPKVMRCEQKRQTDSDEMNEKTCGQEKMIEKI